MTRSYSTLTAGLWAVMTGWSFRGNVEEGRMAACDRHLLLAGIRLRLALLLVLVGCSADRETPAGTPPAPRRSSDLVERPTRLVAKVVHLVVGVDQESRVLHTASRLTNQETAGGRIVRGTGEGRIVLGELRIECEEYTLRFDGGPDSSAGLTLLASGDVELQSPGANCRTDLLLALPDSISYEGEYQGHVELDLFQEEGPP